jgi:YidC/Oxa1 family membrane protein insertase
MDRRTTFALVLCMLVFAVFTALQSRYMPKPKPKPPVVVTAPVAGTENPAPTASAPPSGTLGETSAVPRTPTIPARSVVIETPLYRASFSNIGARLQSFELKRYAASWGRSRFGDKPGHRPKRGELVPAGDRVELRGAPAFAFDLGSGPALRSLAATPFAVEESTDASGATAALTFVARDSAGFQVRQSWHVHPDSYLLDYDVTVAGAPSDARDWSLTTRSWPLLSEANPDQEMRVVRAISLVGKDLHRDVAQGLVGKSDKVHEGAAHWAGVQSHYFLGVVAPVGAEGRGAVSRGSSYTLAADEAARLPHNSKTVQPIAEGTLVMSEPSSGHQRFAVYFGPADYFSIAKLSGAGKPGSLQLEKAVDLGAAWLLPFSYPLLQLLRLLFRWVGNFGLAIFLLATLVRLVLHPINMSSMKSMRAMQRLQPEMERIREKYKNKPEALNAAVMALYKENKVNPAGGCLPMLLQMPLFFALYAVLNSAIDLRQAPFIAWIHDLSAPDHLFSVAGFPIHLLPLIMAGTGFLQQKLTPTPAQQASTMYMMNFFMLFIFYGLPSGLVFYWTVMNLYTALQQWLAIRGDDGVVVPVVAGSPRVKS